MRRFLVISAMGVDSPPPPGTDPVFATYLKAKGEADADIASRPGPDWTRGCGARRPAPRAQDRRAHPRADQRVHPGRGGGARRGPRPGAGDDSPRALPKALLRLRVRRDDGWRMGTSRRPGRWEGDSRVFLGKFAAVLADTGAQGHLESSCERRCRGRRSRVARLSGSHGRSGTGRSSRGRCWKGRSHGEAAVSRRCSTTASEGRMDVSHEGGPS
ncbi:hypothetical protein ACH40D_24125 [Streptomyces olivaceoviridis]|uniref:Uncharacterized protein n=2 Tax=Streptomyces TaxID=1883 RepID=A0ABW7V5L5_STROI